MNLKGARQSSNVTFVTNGPDNATNSINSIVRVGTSPKYQDSTASNGDMAVQAGYNSIAAAAHPAQQGPTTVQRKQTTPPTGPGSTRTRWPQGDDKANKNGTNQGWDNE